MLFWAPVNILFPFCFVFVIQRDPSGSLKSRDPEYEKRRRSADILSYNKDDESVNEEPSKIILFNSFYLFSLKKKKK